MNNTKVIIIGASGHGRTALDIARSACVPVAGFVDRGSEPGTIIDALPVLSCEPEQCADLREGADWFVAVGDNVARDGLFVRLREMTGREPVNLIHPSAVISPRATLGHGLFVAPGAIVNTDSRLGDGVILNTGATVDHDGWLDDFAQICPGCHLAGNTTVGVHGFLGTGAVTIPGVTVGADAVVGAGAVVIRDVPAGAVVVGVPARERA